MSIRLIKISKKSGFILLLLLLCCFVYFFINRTQDTRLIDTKARFTTNEIISFLDEEDDTSLDSYIEKAIEIKGVLKETNLKRGKYTLLLAGKSNQRLILCEMQDDQQSKIQQLKKDSTVVVKGIFKGVLLDAILLNCIIIDTKVYE